MLKIWSEVRFNFEPVRNSLDWLGSISGDELRTDPVPALDYNNNMLLETSIVDQGINEETKQLRSIQF